MSDGKHVVAVDLQRRHVVGALGVAALGVGCAAPSALERSLEASRRLQELESASGGRLGVCVRKSGSSAALMHRGAERFALCSTFKLLLAALTLREAELGGLSLDEFLAYTQDDMVPYAPVTSANLQRGGMTARELAAAAQRTSDNVAANVLLERLGGPAGFTARLRASGDAITRLDRYEPALNRVPAGEVRDTTAPCAMVETVLRYLRGTQLSAASRDVLREWMLQTRTGARRLRAGLPGDWTVGDKTGTGIAAGMANKYNDVAAVWLPDGEVLVIAAYFEANGHYDSIRAQDEAVLARVGEIAARWWSGSEDASER